MNIERSIACINDGGKWTFSEAGKVQPFEDPASYKLRSTREKFTPGKLEQYAKALGIDVFNPSYYQPEHGFFLISKSGQSAQNMRSYSLEEANSQ
jgi:hypothetical protein